MKLYQIVTRDVMRRKRRVLYTALGVVVGTMTVVAVSTIAVAAEARIYNQLEKYGANLTITPAVSNIDMKLGDLSLGTLTVGENYISEERLPEIRKIVDGKIKEALGIKDGGDIATIAPKLYISTKVRGTAVMAVGIDPTAEHEVKTWWQIGQGEYFQNGDQVLAGAVAAELLRLTPGDTITLNTRNVTVTGILDETGSNDDYQIFVPIKTLQRAFNKDGLVSTIDVRALCNACPVDIIADGINRSILGVRAVAVKQVAVTEMGMVEKVERFMLALAGITLVVGCLGVASTMMASIHERIKDIGIMRAVGASGSQIVKMLVYEGIIIGTVGGIFGYVVGTLLAYIVGPLIFKGATVNYVPTYFPLSLALAILTAVVAAIYPTLRATRIKVADAFRSL